MNSIPPTPIIKFCPTKLINLNNCLLLNNNYRKIQWETAASNPLHVTARSISTVSTRSINKSSKSINNP